VGPEIFLSLRCPDARNAVRVLRYARTCTKIFRSLTQVLIDGKETGIDHLDWIFDKVKKLGNVNDAVLSKEILKRVKQFNYVPTKKANQNAAGLVAAYRKSLVDKG